MNKSEGHAEDTNKNTSLKERNCRMEKQRCTNSKGFVGF